MSGTFNGLPAECVEAEKSIMQGKVPSYTCESKFKGKKGEAEGENFQHLHRYLTVLKHLGVLDRAAGIVFGEWADIPADMGDYSGSSRGGTYTSVADMISRQFLDGLDIPVAFGFPAGHGDVNYPLLMGAKAHLKVTGKNFTLSY